MVFKRLADLLSGLAAGRPEAIEAIAKDRAGRP
jgi:hypothetical protein